MEEEDPEIERMQRIYREWGRFFSVRQLLDKAALYYGIALELKEDDSVALCNRSACYGAIADIKRGLIDATKALILEPQLINVNLQYCDTWFSGNEFEKCLNELYSNALKFSKQQQQSFQYRADIVEAVMLDSLGDSFRIFANQNRKLFAIVWDMLRKAAIIDDRPLYKILNEAGKCDVVSILEAEIKLLHPREIKRRRVCYESLIRTYFNKSAVDVLFLESLPRNPAFALKQTPKSSKGLLIQAYDKYNKVYTFMKMLQARSPVYNEKQKKCPNKILADESKQNHLLRVGIKTRNNMFRFLDKIKQLRKDKNIKELAQVVEEWMSKFVDLKTDRILPRKLEFMHHIYNTLGLAYLDQLEVPENIIEVPLPERLQALFKIIKPKDAGDVTFIFGDKSTFVVPDKIDYSYIAYKRRITKLETRYKLAKFNIEKLYIQHAIAVQHAKNSKFKESYAVALKLIAEAQEYKSPFWQFLGQLLQCNANAGLYRIEKLKEDLDKTYKLAVTTFDDPRLNNFLKTCIDFNTAVLYQKVQMSLRRSNMSMKTIKTNRSMQYSL